MTQDPTDYDRPKIRVVPVLDASGSLTPEGSRHQAIYRAILAAPWFATTYPSEGEAHEPQ